MTLTLDERLERIDALRALRHEKKQAVDEAVRELAVLDSELEDVLSGATPRPLTIRDKQKEKPDAAWPKSDRKKTADRAYKRFGTKPCCGSAGPRHKKGCTEAGKESVAAEPEVGSENQGGEKTRKIRELLENGYDDDSIAAEVGTSPRVVAFLRTQMRKKKGI